MQRTLAGGFLLCFPASGVAKGGLASPAPVAASADGDRPDGVLGLGLHWVVICTAFGLGRKAGKGRLGKLPALSRPVFFLRIKARDEVPLLLASRLISPAVLCVGCRLAGEGAACIRQWG